MVDMNIRLRVTILVAWQDLSRQGSKNRKTRAPPFLRDVSSQAHGSGECLAEEGVQGCFRARVFPI